MPSADAWWGVLLLWCPCAWLRAALSPSSTFYGLALKSGGEWQAVLLALSLLQWPTVAPACCCGLNEDRGLVEREDDHDHAPRRAALLLGAAPAVTVAVITTDNLDQWGTPHVSPLAVSPALPPSSQPVVAGRTQPANQCVLSSIVYFIFQD